MSVSWARRHLRQQSPSRLDFSHNLPIKIPITLLSQSYLYVCDLYTKASLWSFHWTAAQITKSMLNLRHTCRLCASGLRLCCSGDLSTCRRYIYSLAILKGPSRNEKSIPPTNFQLNGRYFLYGFTGNNRLPNTPRFYRKPYFWSGSNYPWLDERGSGKCRQHRQYAPICWSVRGMTVIYIPFTEFEIRYEQDFARPAVKLVTETLRLNDSLAVSTCREYVQCWALTPRLYSGIHHHPFDSWHHPCLRFLVRFSLLSFFF